MTERTYNVAVIGYGLSSKVFMIPFLLSQLKLHAIVQRTPTKENDAQHDHPGVRVYRTSDEMLKDEAVDLVIVATPPPTHFTLCEQALEAGNHVVCEKPFTMNTQEADSLIALAAQKKLLLTVFHNRRWDADFSTVTSLIRAQRLERVAEFESHFDWHAPLPRPGWETTWRTDTGSGAAVLYDLGSHLIDQVLQLFGMPQSVTAFLYHQRENGAQWGDADSMTVILQYDKGPFVTLKASIMNAEPEQLRFWVRGTKGAYKKYHLDIQEPQIVRGTHTPESLGFGQEPESHYGILSTINEHGTITSAPLQTLPAPTYKAFWKQLTEALDGQSTVPVKPQSARDVIKVIELATQSALEKRSIPI